MHTARARSEKRTQAVSLDKPNVTACIRCRQRKKRCDQRLPRCTLCESAQVDCVISDPATKRTVPRSYVHNLEERVAFLELKLQSHGIHDYDESPDTSSLHDAAELPQPRPSVVGTEVMPESPFMGATSSTATAQTKLDEVLNLVQHNNGREPVFSRFLLNELMRSKTSFPVARIWPPTSRETDHLSNMVSDLDNSLAPLPDKKGALYLTRIYFEFVNDSYPLMHEPTFRSKLEQLYKTPHSENEATLHTDHVSGLTVFFVFMVFALALLVLQKNNNTIGVPTSLCDRYHKTALKALKGSGLPSDVEGVQALILITQYSYHGPDIHGVWKTAGMALRLSVELGLHLDQPNKKLDFLNLDTLRRTFWVAYAMDRTIAITLGLPSCLSDGSISAKFPSDIDDEYITSDGISDVGIPSRGLKRYSIHLLRYRQFQSEMQTVLDEEKYAELPVIDYENWQKGMHERIKAWYDCAPEDYVPGNVKLNTVTRPDIWELALHCALLFLYRPSPRIPSLSNQAFAALAKSSRRVIHLYRRIFLDNRVTILWQAIENLFSAGTSLLFSYVNSTQIQQGIGLQSLEADIHACSSLLWGMVERVPAFKAKRDAFDIIATKILADLNPNTKARDSLSDSDLSRESSAMSMGEARGELNYPFSGGWNSQRNDFLTPSFQMQAPTMIEDMWRTPMVVETELPDKSARTAPSQPDGISSASSFTAQVLSTNDATVFGNDDMAIDWEAFENANDPRSSSQFLPSTWL